MLIPILAELTGAGLAIFPCAANKRPCTPRGFHDATKDLDDAVALFRRFPGPLIGVASGEVSGYDALDIDPKTGGMAWWNSVRHRIPASRTHRTRSGGLHVIFRHHPGLRCSAGKIGPGVDTRGTGGYFIYWPAAGLPILNGALPAEWPDWLVDALIPPPVPEQTQTVVSLPISRASSDRLIASALAKVRTAAEGQRHFALRNAALTIGGLLDIAGIGEAEAKRVLVEAARDAGAADLRNAENTAVWGLKTGRAKPLNLGARA